MVEEVFERTFLTVSAVSDLTLQAKETSKNKNKLASIVGCAESLGEVPLNEWAGLAMRGRISVAPETLIVVSGHDYTWLHKHRIYFQVSQSQCTVLNN